MTSRRPVTDHGRWPDADQRRLLRAATSTDAAAFEECVAWLRAASWDDLEPPTRKLVPAALRRMAEYGVAVAPPPEVAAFERDVAERNERLVAAAGRTVALLADAGIEALLLKGAVLLLRGFADPATRPMYDVDVLVRMPDLPRAIDVLRADGWTPDRVPTTPLAYEHAYDFRKRAERLKCDVHHYLTAFGSTPAAEDALWRAATALPAAGEGVRGLCPTHLLFHACVAGLPAGRWRNPRWVLDAHGVLASGAAIDWDAVVGQARMRYMVAPVREALSYLADEFGEPVPERVLAELWRRRPTRRDRATYAAVTRHPSGLRELARSYAARHRVGSAALGRRRTVAGYARFVTAALVDEWGLDSRWSLPLEVGRRLVLPRRPEHADDGAAAGPAPS